MLSVGLSTWLGGWQPSPARVAAKAPKRRVVRAQRADDETTQGTSYVSPEGVISQTLLLDAGRMRVVGRPDREGTRAFVELSAWGRKAEQRESWKRCSSAAIVNSRGKFPVERVRVEQQGSEESPTLKALASLGALRELSRAGSGSTIEVCGSELELSDSNRRFIAGFVGAFLRMAKQHGTWKGWGVEHGSSAVASSDGSPDAKPRSAGAGE
jgi:hypothetical protein